MARISLALAATILALTLAVPAVQAQDKVHVRFEAGNDNAAIHGTITGDEYVDYLLAAGAGQRMAVSLIPGESNGTGNVNFNILPPGSTGEAIYIGSIDGLDVTGVVLPRKGEYTIRVYQLGDDADSGKTTAFTISVGIN